MNLRDQAFLLMEERMGYETFISNLEKCRLEVAKTDLVLFSLISSAIDYIKLMRADNDLDLETDTADIVDVLQQANGIYQDRIDNYKSNKVCWKALELLIDLNNLAIAMAKPIKTN